MYRKELTYYFSTPIAYVVIGLYLLTVSLFLWVIPGEWNIIDSGYADVNGLFALSPWLLMLLCPALTMRLFSDEKQSGMWDLLLSKRVPVSRIVWGKYLAAWTLTAVSILPCVVHFIVVWHIAEPQGNVDGGAFAGSMVGLLFLSAAFTAVGLLASSWSGNQIVSFLCGAVACFALYWLTLQEHFNSLSRGVIDLRDVIFFLSVALVGIVLTMLVVSRRK
ncbi:MAG: ABC-2 transporter permease [Paludibacteraceae bacterium]|nr:ABC-2 transporter permease [Paludibacteraceae bacterium]